MDYFGYKCQRMGDEGACMTDPYILLEWRGGQHSRRRHWEQARVSMHACDVGTEPPETLR